MSQDSDQSVCHEVVVEDLLPSRWEYEITDTIIHGSPQKMELTLKVALFSAKDVKLWIKELEQKTYCTYSVRSTEKCTGDRVIFKQRLNCHQNTRNSKTYDPKIKNRTKNKNCPSKLNITIQSVKKKYRGKEKNAPDPQKPCVIVFVISHNHDIFTTDALRFRRVGVEMKQKLLQLYNAGYSPATALKTIKTEIQLSNENYKELLADRSKCPDYNYCYYLYMKEFKKQCGPFTFNNEGKTLLFEKLREYNRNMGEECAEMCLTKFEYIIVLCPPIMKRIHRNVSAASEIVFINATSTIDDGSKVFVLSTHSQCGALPLGIIITSSENTKTVTKGLQILSNLVGNQIFCGKQKGPEIFMLDDYEKEHTAVNTVWPDSKCFLCSFHVLQSVWKWLIDSENCIQINDAIFFYKDFRAILYAPTVEKCEEMYNIAVGSAKPHKNYFQYLNMHWQKRNEWAVCYRSPLARCNETSIHLETTIRFFKEKFFNRMKTFNSVQLVDYLLTEFVDYYKNCLLDAADNRLSKKTLGILSPPPADTPFKKLTSYLFLVPSETTDENLHFIVNTEVLTCTCFKKNCKHIDWVHYLFSFEMFTKKLDIYDRNIFFKIVNGHEPTPKSFLQINESAIEVKSQDSEMELGVTESSIEEESHDLKMELDIVGSVLEDASTEENPENPTPDEYLECEAVEEGEKVIQEMSECFQTFLKQSPVEVVSALKKMLCDVNKITTVDGFVSACTTFGSSLNRETIGSTIPVQPPNTARRRRILRRNMKTKRKVSNCVAKKAF